MSTGLFLHKTRTFGPSRGYLNARKAAGFDCEAFRAQRAAEARRKLDDFAEVLANSGAGESLSAIARRLDIPGSTARGYLTRIQADLGPQAR